MNMMIFRQCKDSSDESCELDHPWVLASAENPSHDLHPTTRSDSNMNLAVEQDRPWKVFWRDIQVRWMSNFGSTEIVFQDRDVFKYQGEQRNGAPMYRKLEDQMTILYLGDDEGDDLEGVSGRWVVAKYFEVGYEEVIVPQFTSDIVEEGQGPSEANWPGYEDDFRHSLHSHVWAGNDLTEVPHDQWKPAVYISGSEGNAAFTYDGEAWDKNERFESKGSTIEPGYYKYPIQAIKVVMNGVSRYFKLYLGEDDYRSPGYSGFTLKDLLTTDIAQNGNDGVFYEHRQEATNDLWNLFDTNNNTNSSVNYPTMAPTNHGAWPEHGKYCVNGGISPVLDVNVDSTHEDIFGRILIRRGPNSEGRCRSYEGIGLNDNITAGFYNENGNHTLKSASIYVLPLPPSCSSFCPSGHLERDDNGYWICDQDNEDDVYCGCHTFFNESRCEECPANTWVGDAHHRLTECIPESCIDECEDGEHLTLNKVESKCTLPEGDTTMVNLDDECFHRTDYTLELQCVPNDASAICDCESYLEGDKCEPCPRGTWVGRYAHNLDMTYCLPKRLGEVPQIPSYNFGKGYIAEDRPNILEILEETTHEGFLDENYFQNYIDLTGMYATNLFELSPFDDSIYKEKAELISDAYGQLRAIWPINGFEPSSLDLYMSYYMKEKEVGYLAQQVDVLVERCLLHQLHCFVLNFVHAEMLASFRQLETLKKATEADKTFKRRAYPFGELLDVNLEDLAAYHEENAKLVVQRAQAYVESDIEMALEKLRHNTTNADNPRVVVSELSIPSSSFMDMERTEYYPIHGVLNFLEQNFTIDTQRKVGRNNDEFLESTEAMLADVRRDIVVTWIARYFSDEHLECDVEPSVRYLSRDNYEDTGNKQWQSYADRLLGGPSYFNPPVHDRARIYACSKIPRIQAYRYKSMWEVWHYKDQEYLEVGRGNADWEVHKQQLAGELFLNQEKRRFLEEISTEIELTTPEYCASDGQSALSWNPETGESNCCEGLVVNPETLICEVACAQTGESPWINGSLKKCCDPSDEPMMEGDKYFCGLEYCVGEGQEYTAKTPCCEDLAEGKVDGVNVCMMMPENSDLKRKGKSSPQLANYRRIHGAMPGLIRRSRRDPNQRQEHRISTNIDVREDSSTGSNVWEGYFCPGETGRYKFRTICDLANCGVSIDGAKLLNEYWDSTNDCVEISISHTWDQPGGMTFEFALPESDIWMNSLTTGLFFQTLPENGLEGYCRGLNDGRLLSYYHENQNVFGDLRSFSRSMDLFTIDMEGCRDQCDRDENCVGFSTTQESFEFPSRCLIHTENLETMPAFGWRAIDVSDQLESSSAIISHSGDRGVHCYSKISKQFGYNHRYRLGAVGEVCDTKSLIRTQAECEIAMKALGLVYPTISWSGNSEALPAFCSYRPSASYCSHKNCASNPYEGHFNTDETNTGRPDLQPICIRARIDQHHGSGVCPSGFKPHGQNGELHIFSHATGPWPNRDTIEECGTYCNTVSCKSFRYNKGSKLCQTHTKADLSNNKNAGGWISCILDPVTGQYTLYSIEGYDMSTMRGYQAELEALFGAELGLDASAVSSTLTHQNDGRIRVDLAVTGTMDQLSAMGGQHFLTSLGERVFAANADLAYALGLYYDFESAIAEINWCSAGIRSGQHCCLKSCGICGGHKCGQRKGGRKGCCHGAIQESKQICRNSNSVACMIPERTKGYIVDFQRASNRHVCSGYNSEGYHMSMKQCQDLCNDQQGCVGIFGAFNTNDRKSVSGNGACYSCHTFDYGEIGWANILLWKPRERAGSFSFDLRGEDGSERVRIDDGVSVRELVLSKEWTAFTTVSRFLQISFTNDDGSRNVLFRSNFDAEIQHPERWVGWNCGFLNDLTEEENSRCQAVRSGRFAWKGDYQVEFIDRN